MVGSHSWCPPVGGQGAGKAWESCLLSLCLSEADRHTRPLGVGAPRKRHQFTIREVGRVFQVEGGGSRSVETWKSGVCSQGEAAVAVVLHVGR